MKQSWHGRFGTSYKTIIETRHLRLSPVPYLFNILSDWRLRLEGRNSDYWWTQDHQPSVGRWHIGMILLIAESREDLHAFVNQSEEAFDWMGVAHQRYKNWIDVEEHENRRGADAIRWKGTSQQMIQVPGSDTHGELGRRRVKEVCNKLNIGFERLDQLRPIFKRKILSKLKVHVVQTLVFLDVTYSC